MPTEYDPVKDGLFTRFFLVVLGLGIVGALVYYANTSNLFGTQAATTINTTATTSLSSLEDGLVGHWTFDGPTISGTTVTDTSGSGNNGTMVNGPTKASGRIGQALSFNGVNQYVSSATAINIPATNQDKTLTAWIFLPSYKVEDLIIFPSTTGNIQLGLDVFGRMIITKWGSGTYGSLSTAIPLNTWTQIVLVQYGSAAQFYINGAADTLSTGITWGTGTASKVNIGSWGSGNYFNGSLDDVRIYNRALSADEVYRLYTLGKPEVFAVSTDALDTLKKGLVGYWKFDEGSGSSAADSSGNGMTGSLTGSPTWTIGRINGALNLDGTDDYVGIADNAALDVGTGDFTYAFWLNPDITNQGVFFSDGSYSDGIMFYRWTDNFTYLWLGNTYIQTVAWAPTASVWQHVVVRRKSGTLKIFADGVEKYSTGSLTGSINSSSGMRIGYGFAGAANAVLDGRIDEFRLYNRALTDTEILRLSRQNVPTNFDSSLVGHWTFDGPELSGTTAYDSSSRGNNGTLTSNPTKTIGKTGQALLFNGSSNYVDVGNKSIIDGASAASICFWMKYNPTSVTADSAMVSKWTAAQGGWLFWVDDVAAVSGRTNTVSFSVDTAASGSTGRVEGSNGLVTPGVWDFYCGTFQNGSYLRLFKNGSLDQESTASIVSSVKTTSNNILIANSADGSLIKYFPGSIDDVRIYNRALSAEEIEDLYVKGSGAKVKICKEDSVQDASSNTYYTLAIGSQCWLDRNMNVGTRISGVTNQTNNGTLEKYCYSNNDSNCTTNHPNKPDGGLYQWNEAMQYSTTEGARGICPTGFHIPTDAEWHTLEKFLTDGGGSCDPSRLPSYACSPAGGKLRPNNIIGFEGNIAGQVSSGGSFANRDTAAEFLTSSESGANVIYRLFLSAGVTILRNTSSKDTALSVRCIQD